MLEGEAPSGFLDVALEAARAKDVALEVARTYDNVSDSTLLAELTLDSGSRDIDVEWGSDCFRTTPLKLRGRLLGTP